jgi:hypothetical protein
VWTAQVNYNWSGVAHWRAETTLHSRAHGQGDGNHRKYLKTWQPMWLADSLVYLHLLKLLVTVNYTVQQIRTWLSNYKDPGIELQIVRWLVRGTKTHFNRIFSRGSTVLKDLGRLTYRILELFRHMVGLLWRVIRPSQGLYLHRTTQHRNTRTNIHALSWIRTHDPSNQPANTHASDCTATLTGKKESCTATCYEGAWGERRYSSYSYLTSALDGGEWSASRPGCALPPGKGPPVPTGQEAGWVPKPVWTQRLEEKSSASVGDRTPVVQSVVRHYTDWATPGP